MIDELVIELGAAAEGGGAGGPASAPARRPTRCNALVSAAATATAAAGLDVAPGPVATERRCAPPRGGNEDVRAFQFSTTRSTA